MLWCGWPLTPSWKKKIAPSPMPRRLLELFSGTGSMGRAFEELGWEVISLDVDSKASPTICADICSWEPLPMFAPGYFDMIWASPVCTEYSRVLTRRPRRLEEGDRLVLRTLQIIQELQPRFWAMGAPPRSCAEGLLSPRRQGRSELPHAKPAVQHPSRFVQRDSFGGQFARGRAARDLGFLPLLSRASTLACSFLHTPQSTAVRRP